MLRLLLVVLSAVLLVGVLERQSFLPLEAAVRDADQRWSGMRADWERAQAVQERKDRFAELCMPRKGDLVLVEWVRGELICSRTTPSAGRYGRTFPHVETRVSTLEDIR